MRSEEKERGWAKEWMIGLKSDEIGNEHFATPGAISPAKITWLPAEKSRNFLAVNLKRATISLVRKRTGTISLSVRRLLQLGDERYLVY